VPNQHLDGQLVDMGDVIVQTRWIVKGLRQPTLGWHIGPVTNTVAADRQVRGTPVPATGRVDLIMDLLADQKVALTPGWTDEVGNPTSPPAVFTVTYTVDDPTIINLTDNGDGSAVAAATGTLGTANVHAEATINGGSPQSADLQLVVVAGLAERFTIVAGTPEEVTPDV
jgi:hypothetical protein